MIAPTEEHTLTENVYRTVRAELIAGVHEQGTPLRVPALRARFGVSMSVIREALIRLAEQGLLTVSPKQGFRVRVLTREDLEDLTKLRVLLETTALEDSIRSGDSRWEADLLAAHHILQSTRHAEDGTAGTSPEWDNAHAAFHDALISACGSPRLMEITRTLRDNAEVYRQLSASAEGYEVRGVAQEHREIMEATLARDSERASRLLAQHLRKTCDAVVSHGVL